MELPLRETLRRLCLEFGWSYAVFWKTTCFGSPMHLMWEDGYCERKLGMSGFKVSSLLLKKQGVVKTTENGCFSELGCQADDGIGFLVENIMASQVHVVGDGLIGQAASTGKHQWINRDTFNRLDSTSEGFAEMDCQIVAGIQTIVVVPVLPFGVIQLGSTQMVLENIAFVHHVKDLFTKLNCGSRALPADTTQKDFQEKSRIYSSPGMLSGFQSTDICTSSENILPMTANGCNPKLVRLPAPKFSFESLSVVSTQLNKKMQPSASEVMSNKETIKTAYLFGKPALQSTRGMFPETDMEIVRQTLLADTGSECQNESLSSALLSNSFRVLEEQLMLTSVVGTSETTNNLPTSLEKTRNFPIDIKSESHNNNVGELSNIGSLSCGVAECLSSCANLSASKIPPISHKKSHSLRNFGISMVPKNGQPFSINKVSHGVSSTGPLKENNDLAESSCILSSETDVLASCSDLHPDILQEYYCLSNGACPAEDSSMQDWNEYKLLHTLKNDTSPFPLEISSSNDLFCMLGIDQNIYCSNSSLDNVLEHKTSSCELDTDKPKLLTDSDACPVFDSSNGQISCSELFSVGDGDQLLDAVISKINSGAKQDLDDSVSCKTSLTNNSSSHFAGSPNHDQPLLSNERKEEFVDFPPVLVKTEPACSSYGKSSCSFEKVEQPQKAELHRSQISAWVKNIQNVKHDCVSDSNGKKVAEVGKLNRKRPRTGESPRPKPKDRQMIQDRIKELREIVPNGAKCSIDALLEKTIKHMLFLQSVTKHADKLKVAEEPKIKNESGGLLLKDNFEGGATWAFEVGSQPMICPILVEDLNPPRQMLVEMLCKERGLFLEIADFIRGLGLTILKGVMEVRKNKVWARFAVEANRDVTRMDIFLSLVRLLEPTASVGNITAPSAAGNINMPHAVFHQTSVPARVV